MTADKLAVAPVAADKYKLGEVQFLRVEASTILEAPILEKGKGGRNWLARIWREKCQPGGLGREFANPVPPQQSGEDVVELYDLPDWVKAGVAIEFGADDCRTYAKYKGHWRWYGVIVGVWDDRLAVQEYTSARRAIRGSEGWKDCRRSLSGTPTDALVEELRVRGFLVTDKVQLMAAGQDKS